ncbi:MAG TPA: acyltransferase [Candidatus Polarisedimenticolia bacterium]|nr:acyltransferase [Candidatus Polarisedimenticolia bacterium]
MSATKTEAAPKKDLRYYSLDFWRGVACLMVAILHSTPYVTENPAHVHGNIISKRIFTLFSQGWIGVPIFFVISGYCIAAACEGAMKKGMSTRTYFFRRFKRIYPPFWIVLLLLIAMHLAFRFFSGSGADYLADSICPMPTPWTMSHWQWLGTFTLTEGWRDHFIGEPSRFFLVPAWSLGYEEQFYFVCGVAMLFGRKWFYRSLTALSVAVLGIVLVNDFWADLPVEGFFFDGRWLMFAAGVLVFYVLQFGTDRSRKGAFCLLGIASFLALACMFVPHSKIDEQILSSLPFAMLLIVLFKYDRKIQESRWLRPVTFCGVMCYSLYLVHLPVVKVMTQIFYRAGVHGEWATLFLSIPVSVLIAVVIAWGFHCLVERRFLNTPPVIPGASKKSRQEVPVADNPQPSTVPAPTISRDSQQAV